MKTSILALALGMIVLAADPPKPTLVWTQEPDGFMGIPFKSSKADADAVLSSRNEKFDRCAPSSSGGTVCGGISLNIGTSSISLIFKFTDEKFAQALAGFSPSDFETLRDVFIQRYGVAHETTNDIVQTAGGSKYQNLTLQWKGKSVDIFLAKYAETLTSGVFTVTTHSLSEAQSKAKDEAKSKAADKL
jgi:hypothetical protein